MISAISEPLKVYEPRRPSLLAFLGVSVGITLVVFRSIGRDLFELPVLILVGVIALGLGSWLGFWGGRRWVYLYEDRLEIQGPPSNVVRRLFGVRWWTRTIHFRNVVVLGRFAYESKRGAYLIIHEKRGRGSKKSRVACTPLEKYLDLKAEVAKRVPPHCERYAWMSPRKRGPW